MGEINMDLEHSLALSGRGSRIVFPLDQIRMVDERTIEITSSQSETAMLRIVADADAGENGVAMHGLTLSPLSEVEPDA